MNAKEVVKKAIEYVADIFENENPTNIGLEEVVLNSLTNEWEVTVGFSRPWDYSKPGIVTGFQPQQPIRQYKVVRIASDTGEVKSINNRKTANA